MPDDLATMSWAGQWMLPDPEKSVPPSVCWPLGGQIDISERVSGKNNGTIHAQYHWGKTCGIQSTEQPPGVYPMAGYGGNFYKDFHTVGGGQMKKKKRKGKKKELVFIYITHLCR